MSFFKNIRARFGDGAMTIRIKVDKNDYKRSEEVKGSIEVKGGIVDQEAISILIYLMVEKDGHFVSYGDYKVHGGFVIHAGKSLSIPFVIELPFDGPYTTEEQRVFLMANVVKLLAIDQRDKKYINVIL